MFVSMDSYLLGRLFPLLAIGSVLNLETINDGNIIVETISDLNEFTESDISSSITEPTTTEWASEITEETLVSNDFSTKFSTFVTTTNESTTLTAIKTTAGSTPIEDSTTETSTTETETVPTITSKISTDASTTIKISTTTEIPCPSGLHSSNEFCYSIMQSAFPYECPYKDVVAHGGIFSTKKVWQFTRRNANYGYYEQLNPAERHQLFQVVNDSFVNPREDCVVFDHEKGRLLTENCANVNEAQCGYSKKINQKRTYCEAYGEICQTTKTCWCDPTDAHTCQNDCVVNEEVTCDDCRNKFKQYPKAKIQLFYNGGTTITVMVRDPLKLADLGLRELQCFTDAREVTIYSIYAKIIPREISGNQNRKLFGINLNQVGLYVGRYWCEAYLYPDLEKVVSNTVIAGASAFSLCFVVNVTVSASDYNFLPYNAHSSLADLLHNKVNERAVISLVEIFPLDDNNHEHINMSFRLSMSANLTGGHPIDLRREHEQLGKLLQNLTVQIKNCAFCIGDVTVWKGEEIQWPDANVGQNVPAKKLLVQENGLPVTRSCLGSFTYGAYWSEPSELKKLGGESPITQDLYDLVVDSTKTAEEKNELLTDILADVSCAIAYDVYLIATIFEQIARGEFDLGKFVANVNSVTSIDSRTLSKAQEVLNATDMILYNLDVALGTYSNLPGKIVESENVLCQTVDLRATKINGVAIYEKKGGKLVVKHLEDVQSIEDFSFQDLKFASFLPPKLLDYYINHSTSRLVTTTFGVGALFNGKGNLTNFGGVFGVYVTDFVSAVLPEPIPVVFRSLKSEDVYCGHWSYGIDDMQLSILGRWETDVVPQEIKGGYFLCHYEHMTHFALLMGAPGDVALNVVSIIGCTLSFIGVTAILTSGLCFKNWRRSVSVKLLMNFSGALLGQMLFLFVSGFVKYDENNWLCSAVAIGLHYFVISQFCWMLAISYLQYKKFVHLLVNPAKYLLFKACLLGWIFPVGPVIIIFIIDASSYDHNCYLTGIYLQLGIMLPAVCIIAINVMMFAKIFFTLSKNKSKAYGEKDENTLAKIKWGVALYFLTGFSWVFGLLANFFDSLVLSYLFCLTSTVQGLVLCVYFCVLNENVKKMWMKKMSRKRTNTGRGISAQSEVH